MRFLLILCLLAGCGLNPRVNAPVMVPPEKRETAARHLYEAMTEGGIAVSAIRVDTRELNWNEQRRTPDNRRMLLARNLMFERIREVKRPVHEPGSWILALDAEGGTLRLRFRTDTDAVKAEAALSRLMRGE